MPGNMPVISYIPAPDVHLPLSPANSYRKPSREYLSNSYET